jgi:hypothetical protein
LWDSFVRRTKQHGVVPDQAQRRHDRHRQILRLYGRRSGPSHLFYYGVGAPAFSLTSGISTRVERASRGPSPRV